MTTSGGTLLVVASRVVAAAASLAAVALFTRMADTATYGAYALIFSYAFVAYGCAVQWLHISFYGLSTESETERQVSTLIGLATAMLLVALAAIVTAAWLDVLQWPFALALCALTCGLALYNTTVEVVRTLLQSRLLASLMLLRSILLLPAGALALAIDNSAESLALGLAAAYILGAMPALPWLGRQAGGHVSLETALSFARYGWPLLLSFGVMSIAHNVDRLMIGNLVGLETLGPYSAISDILRQSFTVVGEAVAFSVLSEARHAFASDRRDRSRDLLASGFRTLAALAALGAAFFIAFNSEIVRIVFGPDYRALASELLPMMTAAYLAYLFRAYYFGQTIYFAAASRLELMAAILSIAVTVLLSLLLAPFWGIRGYVAAVIAAQIACILLFVVGDRATFRLPMPWRSAAEALAIGAGLVFVCAAIDAVAGSAAAIALKGLVFAAGVGIAVWRLDPFSMRNKLLAALKRWFAPRPRSGILLIVKFRSVGGMQAIASWLERGLTEHGHEVTVTYLYSSSSATLGQKLYGMGAAALLILRGRYQTVVTFDGAASVMASFVGWLAGYPMRMIHQSVLPEEVWPMLRAADWFAGTVGFYSVNVTNSGVTTKAFAAYPASYRRRIKLIPYGIQRPVRKLTRSETWKKYGVPDDGKILLNVGRLADQKNQTVLFPALQGRADLRLVIAGDGPLLEQYQALARSLGIADRIHFLGPVQQPDIADLLYACDVFVFPSVWESFGIAPVEAAQCAVPVVASDLPVLREVLAHDEMGVATFADPRSPEAWKIAVDSALGDDVSTASRLKLSELLLKRYSIGTMIESYLAVLKTPWQRSRG